MLSDKKAFVGNMVESFDSSRLEIQVLDVQYRLKMVEDNLQFLRLDHALY